jgi:polysaccharide biosynthesis transport protein
MVPVKGRALSLGGPKRPAILFSAPTVLGLLHAFRRRWFSALGLGLLTGAVFATASWFICPPPSFTARTLLHIASLQPVILGDTPESRVVFADYQKTQVALVKNRRVLNAALRSPKVRGLPEVQQELEPVDWLEKQIKLDYAISPEILRISITGTEPKSVTHLVDAVRDAYLTEIVAKEHDARLGRLELLKELYQQYETGLKKKREDLRVLANGLGSTDPKLINVKQEFAWKQMHTVQTELLQVQSDLRKAQLDLASRGDPAHGTNDLRLFAASTVGLVGQPLGNGPLVSSSTLLVARPGATKFAVPSALIDEYMKKDREYDLCVKQVAQLEKRRDYLLANTHNAENERIYKLVVADLEAAKHALAVCREQVRPRIIQQVREKYYGDMIGAWQTAQIRIEFLTKLEAMLAKEVEERSKVNQSTSKQSIDLEWLKDDVAAIESTGKRVSGQIHSLQVEIRAGGRIKAIDDSTSVSEDVNSRIKITGVGLGAGFLLVVLGMSYVEFRARKVNKPEELTDGLQLKLLGTMPVVSKQGGDAGKNQNPEASRRFQKYLVDSVDATRLVLLHATRVDSLQVLQTTSAFGGEGKTMLSSHLAVNLATAGYRTLLVDADLRRPAVHKVFHLENQPGLCDVLRGSNLAEVLKPGPVEGLSLLPAGDCRGQPNQLLTRGCLAKLMPTLRQQYDYIIVDSAPLLPVVESQFIAQHVDGVILSVIRNVSRLPAVHAACEKLAMLDVRILGVVVHGASSDSYYHDYAFATSESSKAYLSDSPRT